MNEKKKGFIMYNDYITFIEFLSLEERGALFTAVMQFVNGNDPDLSDASNAVKISFSMIKQNTQRDIEKYEESCRNRSKAAKAREDNKKSQSATKSTIVTDKDKERDTDTETDTEKDTDTETENERDTDNETATEIAAETAAAKDIVCTAHEPQPYEPLSDNSLSDTGSTGEFVPPTLSEVITYCYERKSIIDPERFIDYYTANNWMFGKVKMSDWHAAVRAWEKNERSGKRDTLPQKQSAPSYDLSEIDEMTKALYKDL